MPLLQCQQLNVRIAGQSVCEQLDLSIEPGQCWALLGRNGVGKTTLLHSLAGLRPIHAGNILLQGRSLATWPKRERARALGVLFQERSSAFPSRVLETALIGRHPHLGPWQAESSADLAIARRALTAMELSDLETRLSDTLSGGEQQRLALAAVLTQDPALLLLDEPVNHLDLHHQIQVLTLLQASAGAGKAVVMSLHDVNLATRFCSHVLLLHGGGDYECGDASTILNSATLTRAYGHPIRQISHDGQRSFLPL